MDAQDQVSAFFFFFSPISRDLFNHFFSEFHKCGAITLYPTKSMIGFVHDGKKVAWLTQAGKNFVHIVFPFKEEHKENLCFIKIAQVPGSKQFNHHFRMMLKEDVNAEVKKFMKLSLQPRA